MKIRRDIDIRTDIRVVIILDSFLMIKHLIFIIIIPRLKDVNEAIINKYIPLRIIKT